MSTLDNAYNEMKAITLKELNDWLSKNKKYTSFLGEGGGWHQGGSPILRYLEFYFDTRMMHIFTIKFEHRGVNRVITTTNQIVNDVVQEHKFASLLDYLDYVVKGFLDEKK